MYNFYHGKMYVTISDRSLCSPNQKISSINSNNPINETIVPALAPLGNSSYDIYVAM